MVRYKTSTAGGDINEALVRAVFEELRVRPVVTEVSVVGAYSKVSS